MKKSFTSIEQGKNSFWRYLLSLLTIIFFILISGFFYALALSLIDPAALDTPELILGRPIADLALSHIPMFAWVLGIWFSIAVIHKRSLRTLITPYSKINWKKILYGFLVFFGLMAVESIVEFIIFPQSYSLHPFDFLNYMWLVLVAVLLVPIQTTCEELMFRGFILQWAGKWLRNPILLSIIVGLIFGSLHFVNPEMNRGAIVVGFHYVFIGFMFTYIAVKSNSAELSIGAHAANNVFLVLFIVSDNSVVGDIPSLFIVSEQSPYISTISSAIVLVAFYLITVKRKKHRRLNEEEEQSA
ncbi:CPBP family intramembrane glutamic endopeptidase [Terribacillus sp. DMT04]|uniref:CPBP family intramembrane glutamic endopeptidase n=1 Tax=Terribacillus sp. DMT04 TaxID=2850441 RepID=UPI001C2C38E1|nr:type II CAAX endopeptidase family protein [Terribacillus sp. DMT04]QXE01540.1 CPBP family intramembrane metalloprotease [Terribacillus sp. DMT04]